MECHRKPGAEIVEIFESKTISETEMINVGYVQFCGHVMEPIDDEVLGENTDPRIYKDGRVQSNRTYLSDRSCFLKDRCETVAYTMQPINDYNSV